MLEESITFERMQRVGHFKIHRSECHVEKILNFKPDYASLYLAEYVNQSKSPISLIGARWCADVKCASILTNPLYVPFKQPT